MDIGFPIQSSHEKPFLPISNLTISLYLVNSRDALSLDALDVKPNANSYEKLTSGEMQLLGVAGE